MDRIRLRHLIIDAVKQILFIPLVMDDSELRWVKKPATVQAIHRNEVPPILPSVSKIETTIYGPKASIRGGKRAVGCSDPLPRTGRNIDHYARLFTKFGGRRARDHFQGCNRIQRNLVLEDLALLGGNRVRVAGERVLCVIAHAVKKTV